MTEQLGFDWRADEGPVVADTAEACGSDPGTRIAFAGERFVPTTCGALYWPAEATLIVSDLHLEKGRALAARGALLPPYDSASTLARLARVMARFAPARVIALGDSFHDAHVADQMAPELLAELRSLQQGREWLWILGNHDPSLPDCLAGTRRTATTIRGLTLTHEPQPEPARPQIAGHLHPVARLRTRAAHIRRRCFVGGETSLILPAYGAYTGGLNVTSVAFERVLGGTLPSVWMMGARDVYRVPSRRLLRESQ